ncbi:hypothetical protein QQF64_007873 [Cirrhinus molitorella]|uniref:Gypsy retrotransposon integrase-like protein 1 n=1 Tax=Cirrhinus molitorella TaxID=172907 RepID=A0ABR3M4J0_9TELE
MKTIIDRLQIPVRIQKTNTVLVSYGGTRIKPEGQFPGLHHIHTDPNVPPVIHGCRKIPYAVHDRLRETLAELENRGVISKVTRPTPWVSSLCIMEKKNGTLRVCLDPRDLNRAILRQHYNIPTLEDIRSKLAGKKLFTILDEKDGYWQIKLDEESADLCAFNTPWGRYRFHRMPFGIKSASEVFQRLNSEGFGDIEGVFMVVDDMIIAAATKPEHDAILEKVMNRAKSLNIKFNKDKLQYMVNEVTYLGHVITADGVKPDESKVSAILQLSPPTDRKALQRLLVLRHFDLKEPIEVQADASKDGLGATQLQKQQPIAYTSRALPTAEKNNAQIEKELLAIVFALRKFHQDVYGVPIRVKSDHKPLEAIFSKPSGAAPAWLQRMLLQLQRYDIHIIFTPGNQMLIADTLSRAYTPSDGAENLDLSEEKVIYAVNGKSIGGDIIRMIQQATLSDPEHDLIRQLHDQGWPDRKKLFPLTVQAYWPIRHSISIDDGLLMKDDRIIIPCALRPEVPKRLHVAHQGIQRSLAHARSCFYWPGLTEAIHHMVEGCSSCQQSLPENKKEPHISHPVPEGPCQKIAADIFDFQGRSFLLIVDYFSKYPEVLQLSDKTSGSLIAHFKTVFARHGVPEVLIADHVPFASAEMARFAHDWGFKITHSSPNYPQSNGMVDRAIKTVKSMLKAAAQSGIDPHLALLTFCNTPVTGLKYSTAQILRSTFHRQAKLCCVLPLLSTFKWHCSIVNHSSRVGAGGRKGELGSVFEVRNMQLALCIKHSARPKKSLLIPKPASLQETTESTPEFAPIQDISESTLESVLAQEISESISECALAQVTAESTLEFAPIQEISESTLESVLAQEISESISECALAQVTAESTLEFAPIQEISESTLESVPTQEISESTYEFAPAQEISEFTPESASLQETAESTLEFAPIKEISESTSEFTSLQEISESIPEYTPAQEISESTSQSVPAQETSESAPELALAWQYLLPTPEFPVGSVLLKLLGELPVLPVSLKCSSALFWLSAKLSVLVFCFTGSALAS